MILPKYSPAEEKKTNYDQALTKAFAKAYKWQEMLKKDCRMTYSKIVLKERVTASYVSIILRLNQVAPNIIKAIIEGRQPGELKIQDFMNNNIPDLWEEQRNVCGIILSDQKL